MNKESAQRTIEMLEKLIDEKILEHTDREILNLRTLYRDLKCISLHNSLEDKFTNAITALSVDNRKQFDAVLLEIRAISKDVSHMKEVLGFNGNNIKGDK